MSSMYRPQVYLSGHSDFHPGGSEGWENYLFFVGAHQYVDIALLAIFTFNIQVSKHIDENKSISPKIVSSIFIQITQESQIHDHRS